MQKTNLHQYAIYSFVIFCVAFVFPFALFFFTVILNKLYKFYKREIRSNSSHSSSLNVNALIGDSYDSDAHFHHLHSHPHTHHPHHHQAHLSNVLDCDGNQLTNSSPSSIRLLTSNHPISANENIGLIANASVNANHSSFNRPTNVLGTRIIVAHNPVFDHHFHHHLQNHHNYLNENHAVSNVLGDDVQYNQQQAQLFSYNNQSYHPSYYYQIQDGSTLIALTTANSATNDGPISFSNRLPATEMIVEDNPPSYEMALLCPSVTHNCNQDDSFSRTDGVCQQQSFHCLPKYQISFPDNSVKEEKIKIGLNQIGPESIVNHLDDNNTTLNDQNRRENLCDQKPSQDVQSNETTSVRNNKNADDVDVNADKDDEENEKNRSSSPSSSFNLNQNNNLDRKE
ncbi:hypothetical protein QR98_0060250 [Sarcoptes scabiei]|uniref:Uncharacterized protein n=1 Tax=Sarcoptes scabiei TaxID=52283 RepID=A0A132A9I9_SARSC|nr:hypothetical protein QR98_0060250 [Sarcoptes scabiei]